jgi:LysM repeat protein
MPSFIRASAFVAILVVLSTGCATKEEEVVQYKVKQGDTLFLIGRSHGVSVDDLKQWNDLSSDLIEVDQPLRIYGNLVPTKPSKKTPRKNSRPKPTTGSTAQSLSMPNPKPCLAAPSLTESIEEEGYRGSSGLSSQSIKNALETFLPTINQCLEQATLLPQQQLVLDFRVGCNGQVTDINVSSPGDWESAMTDCVSGILRYTPFPAHALPDGETFLYPIRLAN